ncbi:MAG: helix-turn-helix domain-containing protein [Polyangiales bacterium]
MATKAPHARTRERFMAFYEIACGHLNATTWATASGKHFQTVMSWVHRYNERGPEAVAYRHTGGWPTPFSP